MVSINLNTYVDLVLKAVPSFSMIRHKTFPALIDSIFKMLFLFFLCGQEKVFIIVSKWPVNAVNPHPPDIAYVIPLPRNGLKKLINK